MLTNQAATIRGKIEQLARQAAERCDVNDQPQDWLDENFRRQSIERAVTRVFVDFLLGPQLVPLEPPEPSD